MLAMGLLGSSFRLAQVAAGTALLAGDAAAGAARAIVGSAAEVAGGIASNTEAGARTAASVLVEAIGGPPARRTSSHGFRHWIEVHGLSGPEGSAIADEVLASMRAVPGVTGAVINHSVARVVVTAKPGHTVAELAAVVAEAERRIRTETNLYRHRPLTLPGDDAVLAARTLSAAAAAVGLGLSLTGNVWRVPRLPDLLAVAATAADNIPRVRHRLEHRLGREGSDLLFSLATSVAAALTVSPTAAAAETATRTLLAAEAWNARLAWRRHEPMLARHCPTDSRQNRGTLEFSYGPGERYSERIGWIGLTSAAVIGAVSRNPTIAGTAALVTAPKPTRATREAFGCALTRGLITRHDALVVRPRALRGLDRVDAIVIDPRSLYTDELTVTRVLGVTNSHRTAAWNALRTKLETDGLTPGWHPLSSVRGAGRAGRALISPVRDPLASAVVTEARRTRPRVWSIDDDGLRSLAQGFDHLHPVTGSVDDAIADAVAGLKADGATVALLTTPEMVTPHNADITVGVVRSGEPPPWGADVFVPDLAAAWRILHAMPAARGATARGIQLSASASAIGALMLIPGVAGRGPMAVHAGVLAGLWSGFSSGSTVFREAVPEAESAQDWHALPVAEVRRRLPRPPDEHTEDVSTWWPLDTPPVRMLRHAPAWSWNLARDFGAAVRTNLSDPITPILATGAAASALLGSPLDALLVGGVTVANAALSAEQQLHAEHVLRRLLAVQDPLARRLVGPQKDGQHEYVPANRLRPGDIIEVHADEVIAADARLIAGSSVEVDESSLTGESLPVTKQTEATPGAPLAERSCMLYAGSTLVAGTALAVVTAVGSRTEMRRALAMAPTMPSEIGLQRQLAAITRRALPFSVSGGALVGVLSVFRGTPLRQAVSSAVALTVAAVPEGLPLVATLAQLAAARRLSGESVLIRNAHSIEALARLQVVCFDKTGTLSENRLRVKSVHPVGAHTAEDVLRAAAITTFSRPGHRAHHATDDAIRRAVDGDDEAAAGTAIERDAFLPFQAGRPFAAAIIGTRLTIKGAPEVLESALNGENRPFAGEIGRMAAKGLRVIAVAERRLSRAEAAAAIADTAAFERLCRAQLCPVGLLGLADTPRESARPLLGELASRGIGVRLITGDHPVTAAVIAAELGLEVTAEQVITGSEWEMLSAEERAEAVSSRLVFARMSPEHKIDVVQTLERIGMVTAMVGDGANDAAAIRAASVGVGVAARGSDPARTAADLVLLDGRIEALLDALDEGQELWRRVQSAVSVLFGGNTGEIAFALITSLLTGRSVLNARQMLLVNMLTDGLPAAALAVSPQNGNIAVDRDEAALWRAIGIRGATTTLGATLAWLMASATGRPRRASSVALIGLVCTQLAQTLIDSRGPMVVATAIGSFAILAAAISTPGLSHVFGCTPVGPVGWGQAFLATAVAGLAAALVPELLNRASEALRQHLAAAVVDDESVVVDDDDPGLQENGVDRPKRRRQQPDTGRDERVMAGSAREVGHESDGSPNT